MAEMKFSEGKMGRVFVLKLDDGDMIPGSIEEFAAVNGIHTAFVSLIGCLEKGEVASGPLPGSGVPPEVIMVPLAGVHESVASGFIAPSDLDKPVLHIHGALGRDGQTITGCLRSGLRVWCYSEVVIMEIEGINAQRLLDPETGFTLLSMQAAQKD